MPGKRYFRDPGFFRGEHVFFHIRMFKQTLFKFQLQNFENRLVDLALIEKSLTHGLAETAERFIPEVNHIHTGFSRCNACMQSITLVFLRKSPQTICHHNAVKAHFTAQNIAEQPCVSVAVHAVDLVVCRHDAFHACFTARFCRWKMDFPQLPLADSCSTRVHTSGCLALCAEVFATHCRHRWTAYR